MRTRTSLAVLLGVALGAAAAIAYLPGRPGGYDALKFYLRAPAADTTAPAWVYFFTLPLSMLSWPLGWQALAFLTVLSAGVAAFVWGNRRWWIVATSAPMLWTIWLGQIEVFPVTGLIVGGLVLQRKVHPAWLGLASLLLMTKPQVGYGILLLLLFWIWRDQGLGRPAIIQGAIACVGLLITTVLVWPDWLSNWLQTVSEFHPTWWDAAIWPYGLLAWPLVIFVVPKATKQQALRMVSAASLLGSPYFAMYHSVTCLTLTDNPLFTVLSWLIVLLGRGVPDDWMKLGWLLPVAVLISDVVSLSFARPTNHCS